MDTEKVIEKYPQFFRAGEDLYDPFPADEDLYDPFPADEDLYDPFPADEDLDLESAENVL